MKRYKIIMDVNSSAEVYINAKNKIEAKEKALKVELSLKDLIYVFHRRVVKIEEI